MDDYKVKVLEDMIKEVKSDEYALARLRSDSSATINIDLNALYLLKDYYSGAIDYTSPIETDVRNMTTTELFNFVHDGYKEEFAPDGGWVRKFCEISGISMVEANACYWHNEPIKDNTEANRKVIEYMQSEGII